MKKEKHKIISEFKAFISWGNVIDLAVGIIIGSAFTSIVNSLVKDIVMPLVGVLIGGIDFTELNWEIVHATAARDAVTLNYGTFIQNVVNFFIIALVVFFMVKAINGFRKKKEAEPAKEPEPSKEVLLLTEIRDLLKK
jgi:large conductance mechanosensitive channel